MNTEDVISQQEEQLNDQDIEAPTQVKKVTRTGKCYFNAMTQHTFLSGSLDVLNEYQYVFVADTNTLKVKQALKSPDASIWQQSIDSEIESLHVNRVFSEPIKLSQLPHDTNITDFKWLLKIKRTGLHKSRIVCRGFTQEYGVDYKETFSPVARHSTFRLLLSLGVNEGFTYVHADVKTAFLYASLEEYIYMLLPREYISYMQRKHGMFMEVDLSTCEKSYAVRLLKSLYGLKQAPKEWYKLLDKAIKEFGFKRSRSDVCLYYKGDRENKILILIYVDDIIIAAKNAADSEAVQTLLKHYFNISSEPLADYLGIQITQEHKHEIKFTQAKYLRSIAERVNTKECTAIKTPMSSSVKLLKRVPDKEEQIDSTPFRSGVSSLMYAALLTRYDITYALTCLLETWKIHHRSTWMLLIECSNMQ